VSRHREGADGAQPLAERLVSTMLERDAFSAWLGVEVLSVGPGACTARLRVREEMVNGFGVCHGGVTYSLADSVLAFACNTTGRITVSIENAIAYPQPVRVGDVLVAAAEEEGASRRLSYYRVTVRNQENVAVALFRGTVYRTDRELLPGTGAEREA
jgi:acyl-CoA thioesterase